MYNSNANGTHSYSTPASPNPYSTSSHHNADGKFAYDKDLAALFRATAANVTQLYKEASEIGNNAFKAGYEQCYNDICEFIASEQQDVGIQSADARRVLMERLMDFARLKRLAQRQATAGAASPSGSTCFGYPSTRPASAADYSQSHVEQSRHTIDQEGSSGDALIHSTQQVFLEIQSKHSEAGLKEVESPDRSRSSIGSRDARYREEIPDKEAPLEHVLNSDNTIDEHFVSNGNSSCQHPDIARGMLTSNGHGSFQRKRMLDSFDVMDIEPPRRRLRKDDIEML